MRTAVISPVSTWEQAWDGLGKVSAKGVLSARLQRRLLLKLLQAAVNKENKSLKARIIPRLFSTLTCTYGSWLAAHPELPRAHPVLFKPNKSSLGLIEVVYGPMARMAEWL